MKFLVLTISLILSSCGKGARTEGLPEFKILLIDSTTILNSKDMAEGRPFVIFYFSPDCEGCQEETEGLLKNMNMMKNINFYFITNDPFERLRVFQKHYKLSSHPNVILTKDFEYSFLRHFNPGVTPYIIIYDKNSKLRAIYSGGNDIKKIVSTIKEFSN